MNEELLKLNEILDPSNPTSLSRSTRPWVIECLKEVGWNEGDRVPGRLQQYFASVFNTLGMPKTPDSIRKAITYDEVRMALSTAIKKVYEMDHAQKVAEERFSDFAGEDTDNPLMRQIYEEAVKAEAEKIRSGADDEKKEEEEEEDFSDLEGGSGAQPTIEPVPTLPICPCCQWDLTKEYSPVELTESEQRSYLLYVLGKNTFTKRYNLWGGQCSVVFKATKNQEEELFTELYSKDMREGRLENGLIAQKRFNQYHLALSIESISFSKELGIQSPVAPSVWSYDFAPTDNKTRLQQFMEKWYLKTVESIEFENALMHEWRKFNDLLVSLQQELYRRDFWQGATSV